MKNEKHEVSNTVNSYTKEKKKDFVQEKRNTNIESKRPPTKIKTTGRLTTENLDERLIDEVAKRIKEV